MASPTKTTAQPKNKILLKVTSLSKSFHTSKGKVDAVKDVSFEVKQGQFFGIIGESGSGKTTLGRTVIGLHPSTYGSIFFEDELINVKLPRAKKRWKQRSISMIFQDPLSSLNGKKNVLSLISEPLVINKASWAPFHKKMATNLQVVLNFKYTMEKHFRTKYFDHEQVFWKKVIEIYRQLQTDTLNFVTNARSMPYDKIIEYIETEFFKVLLDANYETLKQVRNVGLAIQNYYDEMEQKYLANEMEADEVAYKKASVELHNLEKHANSSKELDKLRAKIKVLQDENNATKIEYSELKSFSKTFLKNFLRSVRISRQDEFFKYQMMTDIPAYDLHKAIYLNLRTLKKAIRKLKRCLLKQTEVDAVSNMRLEYFKIGQNPERAATLLTKILDYVKVRTQINEERFQVALHKNDTAIQELETLIATETAKVKAAFEQNKEAHSKAIAAAKQREATAKNVFETERKEFAEKTIAWRKAFLKTRRDFICSHRTQVRYLRKGVNHNLQILIRIVNQKIRAAKLQAKFELVTKSKEASARIFATKLLSDYEALTKLEDTKARERAAKLLAKSHAMVAKSKKLANSKCALLRMRAIKLQTQYELLANSQNKTASTKAKSGEVYETESILTRKMIRHELLVYKVTRRSFKNVVKADRVKQRALGVEMRLERKQIHYTQYLLGMSRLPRFIIKRFVRKNYLIQTVYKLLVKVGLKPEHAYRYPHEFSGGQRQRIGIARAIITNPKLIIADEPISALDVSIQAQIVNILRDLTKEIGCTLLFIAHDLSMISYICDEIIIMSNGRVLEKGLTQEIFDKPKHPYTIELLNSVPELSNVHRDLAAKIGVKDYQYDDNQEYDFVKIKGDENHYILANDEQTKEWT